MAGLWSGVERSDSDNIDGAMEVTVAIIALILLLHALLAMESEKTRRPYQELSVTMPGTFSGEETG